MADAQGAYETQMSLWGAVLGGANLVYHAAGWQEGGLTASFEKFILDVEMLQMMMEFLQPIVVDEPSLGFDALRRVPTGGHFFGDAAHDGTLRARVLPAAGLELAELRELGTGRGTGQHPACDGDLAARARGIRAAGRWTRRFASGSTPTWPVAGRPSAAASHDFIRVDEACRLDLRLGA